MYDFRLFRRSSVSHPSCVCLDAVLLIWNICRERLFFHSENCLKSCNILMFGAQRGICGSWKGNADSHSTLSYRLCSPAADSHTSLIIQTSARRQKEIEAKYIFFFFFSGSQSGFYLPHRNLASCSSLPSCNHFCFLHGRQLLSFISRDIRQLIFCRRWPPNKFPWALLHLSTFGGYYVCVCLCVFRDIINRCVRK